MQHVDRPVASSTAVKVLVSGAFGTGKSTLVAALVAALKTAGTSVSAVGEIPRRCPYALNKDQTPLASAWLVSEQIRSEIETCIAEPSVVICDRGVLDMASHTRTLFAKSASDETLIKAAMAIVQAWSPTYDVVLWAKIDPQRAIEPDGLRIDDRMYQEQLQDEIARVFLDFGVEVIELPNTLEERLKAAAAAVTHLLERKRNGRLY